MQQMTWEGEMFSEGRFRKAPVGPEEGGSQGDFGRAWSRVGAGEPQEVGM